MGKLDLSLLVGAETKQFLADLTTVVERLEALGAAAAKTVGMDVEKSDEKPKRATGKASKPVDEDQEIFDLGADESEDEEPAITKKDLIAACRDNREAAIKTLKKMKVASVHDLKPAQYAKVMAELGA